MQEIGEKSKSWFLRIFGLPEVYKIRKKYQKMNSVLKMKIEEKDSYIDMLETYRKEAENRHILEMKGINLKLDLITKAYEQQSLELKSITRELLIQKKEAREWRLLLEALLDFHQDGPDVLGEMIKKVREVNQDEDEIT